ncbi:MAG: SH3 domain-containing protein [Clostridia bacterium]|nr:SH3 domain-containing protein [Clostridia bacterium]
MERAARRRLLALFAGVVAALVLASGCGSIFTSTTDTGVTLDTLAQRVDQLEAEVANLESQVAAMGASGLGSEAQATQGGAATVAVVTADVLNVRQEPDVNSQRIGVLMKGARVTVEKVEGDWSEINFNNTLDGWVASQYLEVQSGQ